MLVNYKLTEKKHWHIQGTVPSVRQTTIARDMLEADSSAVATSGLKWKFLKINIILLSPLGTSFDMLEQFLVECRK